MVGYFVAWLGLIIANMPVAFSLILMGMAWLLLEGGLMITAPQRLIGGIDSFPLLAVPCFILAGIAMNTGGVTERIYGFASALVGHFTGGLGHVNVLGSLIFSGMSGSAIADAGGLGLLEIKAMKEDGYPAEFAGRAHLRVLHHRPAGAAVDPDGALRRDRQRLGRRAVPRRRDAGAS